ncbi:tetratricopeptide repeat protein [Siphonobacter aquaeclarae]|uniref:TolA-binding protein n=1 Tax=Siphonobacter aquaeclarae TaxID=563176 RepID=A0A1G9RP75_9BACT|nr:tetratricopeptide repeat protein [Siphonobacter aquaeclarae]SDM24984.1 TolA-binding protein [Siphonobacter aquaeclarae]
MRVRRLSLLGSCLLSFYSAETVFAQNTTQYTSSDALYQAGVEFIEKKNYASASQEFKRYLQTNKGLLAANDLNAVNAEYYIAMSALYLNYPEAEVLAERFVKNHGEHPKARQLYGDLGAYYYNAGDYAKAIPYLQKAYGPDASFKLGMSLYYTNRYDEALKAFGQVLGSQSEYVSAASYYSGVIRFKNEDYAGAVEDFRRIENSREFGNEVPGWIAHSYYRQGQYDKLVAYTEPILRQGPKSGKKLDELSLLTADVFFQKGNYAKAAEYYKYHTNLKGGRLPAAAAYRYGYSQYRLNDFNGAIANLKQLSSSKDTIGQYSSYYLGISYLNTDNLSAAAGSLDQARKLNYNAAVKEDASFNHAKLQLDMGNGAGAVSEFDEFLKAFPNSSYVPESKELRGEGLLLSNNYAQILDYLEKERNLSPKQRNQYQQAAYNLGINAFNAEQFDKAIGAFDKATKYTDNRDIAAAAKFYKAEAYSAQHKYEEVIPQYNQLIASTENSRLVPDFRIRSRYGLGYAYYNTKDYDKAATQLKAYTDAVRGLPATDRRNYEDAMIRLADTYLVAKRYDEANKIYDQVVVAGKSDKDNALYNKGLSLLYAGKYAEAKTTLSQMLNQYPNSPYSDDAMFQLGMVELNQQNYPIAVRQFTRVIQERPNSPILHAAFLQRAIANSNLKKYDEAIADYKIILTKYAGSKSAESALLGVQDALNAVGRPEDFAQILKGYEQGNPSDESLEKIKYEAAKNLYFSEKYPQAVEALLEFFQRYPGSAYLPEANYYLGDSYFRTEDKISALRYYNKVISENKTSFVNRAAQRVGEIEFQNQNYRGAVRGYQVLYRAAANNKDKVAAQLGLMDAYLALPKPDSALIYAKEVINGDNSVTGARNRAQLTAGKIALAKGDNKRAIEEFEKTAKLGKDSYGAEAIYNVAAILFKEKKCKESRDKIINELKEQFSDQKWIDQGFLLLSDVYVCLNEGYQAKALLNTIIEGAEDKAVVEEAKRKLALIK